jgi:midasin
VDKLNRNENPSNESEPELEEEADEYQHVKDAKKTDKTTMDNATEEQSKKIEHKEDVEQEKMETEESQDQLPDENDLELNNDDIEQLESAKIDKKSDRPGKEEKSKDICEVPEEVQVEGETVETFGVARGDETTAHLKLEILNDVTAPDDPTNEEALEMRKLVEAQLMSTNRVNPEISDMEAWQEVSNKMMSNARELCEQLRLILEPTKCTRLKGDYRTGRRINMKKVSFSVLFRNILMNFCYRSFPTSPPNSERIKFGFDAPRLPKGITKFRLRWTIQNQWIIITQRL